MTRALTAFLDDCRLLPDGFVGNDCDIWRLGAVLVLRDGDAIAAVQKATVKGYEFSGAWSLPGGMARTRDVPKEIDDASAAAVLAYSLSARAEAEAGIGPDKRSALLPAAQFGPIVTRYTVRDVLAYTLMVVHEAKPVQGFDLSAADRSIVRAAWLKPPIEWERLAPANRALLAHALWPQLSEAWREASIAPIAEAIDACSAWGEEVGWPVVPPPWAPAEAIAAWRGAWRRPANH